MEIKLLTPGYKNSKEFYKAFKEDRLWDSEFLSDKSIWISHDIPDFPIYFPSKDDETREKEFLPAIRLIDENVIDLDRDYYMDELFWHSILCLYKREYYVDLYPEILEDEKKFRNIITKNFNWENYIYKAILIAQYVADTRPDEKEKYYHLILSNMDMFNYIIKYEIFRNATFLINIMDIIEETGLSSKLKEKIKDRPDLAADERYGRRVIRELNKSYPIVMSPMLDKENLKTYFLRYLAYYTEYKKSREEIEHKVVSENTDSIELDNYSKWLKLEGFKESQIESYIEILADMSDYYKEKMGMDFFKIEDVDEIKKVGNVLLKKFKGYKAKTTIKYYVEYKK